MAAALAAALALSAAAALAAAAAAAAAAEAEAAVASLIPSLAAGTEMVLKFCAALVLLVQSVAAF